MPHGFLQLGCPCGMKDRSWLRGLRSLFTWVSANFLWVSLWNVRPRLFLVKHRMHVPSGAQLDLRILLHLGFRHFQSEKNISLRHSGWT